MALHKYIKAYGRSLKGGAKLGASLSARAIGFGQRRGSAVSRLGMSGIRDIESAQMTFAPVRERVKKRVRNSLARFASRLRRRR